MAGAGYKLFNTGDVLTAAQVNTYLMEQTIMVFANTTARDTALSGVLAQGMQCFLKDTNTMQYYSGSAWVTLSTGGDITSVVAGTGLSGGGTSGDVTLNLSTPVSATNGGTAQSTYATGDLLYASGTNTLAKRTIGSTGNVLTVSGGVPTWSAPAGSGLTLITSASFSGVSSVSLPTDTFTTTYDNYRVLFTVESAASSPTEIRFRMRAAGSDNTTTSYAYASSALNYAGGTGNNNGSSVSYFLWANTSNGTAIYTRVGLDVMTPKLAQTTVINALGGSGTLTWRSGTFFFDATTQFDSMTFYVDAGNFTGKYRVYGYQNS